MHSIMYVLKHYAMTMVICVIAFTIIVLNAFAENIDYRIVSTIPAPGPNPHGVAWDGSYLWVGDAETDSIYKVNPEDGSVILSFPTPGSEPRGMTWCENQLILMDDHDIKMYFINTSGDSPP